ncbi:MAG: glycosyltransferase family 39 protein [Endomicrobiia bacterium]
MKQKYVLWSSILLFSFFGMFGKLHISDLQPLGSAAHASIAREILRTNDWLTLHWPHCEEFSDFYQFPPLFFWLQAICFKVFGISDATAKYVSSFFGILVIISTFILAKIITKDNYVGFLSAMTLILHPYFFRHARKCELETGLMFFITMGIIFFVISEIKNNYKYLLLSGLFSGLGFLYKGPPAYCIHVTILVYFVITKQYKKILNIYYIGSILIGILIPFIWFIPQLIHKGNALIEKYFVNQIFWSLQGRGVVFQTFFEKVKSYLFFVPVFFSYYLPWSATGFFGVYKVIKEKNKIFYSLIIWAAVVWIGFTLAGYKDDYYLLAFWPGWCVMNGYIFSFWTQKIKDKLINFFAIMSIIFTMLVILTPIKFDKIRNPEFKSLSSYVKNIVPENKKIIPYRLFYYDMVALIPWYWDRGVERSSFVDKNKKVWKYRSIETEEELFSSLNSLDKKFLIIKKTDYEKLSDILKNKILILKEEGRFYFCESKPKL